MSRPPDSSRDPSTIYADLHTHTDHSDGRLSPARLVERAAERDISALAVTDHDTTAGLEAALAAGRTHGLTVLTGAELSVTLDENELHLLVYGFDPTHEALREHLRRMQEARRRRVWKMVDRLRTQGVEVEEETLREEMAGTAAAGRPHLAAALVHSGHVDTLQAAFDRYLGRDGPGFVSKPAFPVPEALTVVHEAGGIGVLAHPGHWTSSTQIRRLVAAGLDGLEVYHPSHGASLRSYYRRVARSYDLLVTGGSDYHGRTADEETNFGRIGLNTSGWERFRAAVA
jgi:predicted metal-dependent phosphoesterase TrpH